MQVRKVTGAALVVAIVTLAHCAPEAPVPPPPAVGAADTFTEAPVAGQVFGFTDKRGKPLPSKGTVNVLVLFAGFRGSDVPVPEFVDRLFAADVPGSFTHFYDTMSFGQLRVEATAIPRRYSSRWGANRYVASSASEWGSFDRFILEILQQADRDLDFGDFDNDGPDGEPNSGDDDGEVDFPFIMLSEAPRNFIRGGADGIAQLGFDQSYESDDESARGRPIRVSGRSYRGAIVRERDFDLTASIMIHEFGHGLGLPDLYNIAFMSAPGQPLSADGAGIGLWGIMGSAESWDGTAPSPFSAWTREELEWIDAEDGRLVEVAHDTTGLAVRDLHDGGSVVKIPLGYVFTKSIVVAQEYLLLEMRRRGANHYQRNLPAEGLLIWHVRPQGSRTMAEDDKLIDLVCADGLYGDAGYPRGSLQAPLAGHDNLDFWAKDNAYRETHQGNKGDHTDPFDGVHYGRFAPDTNPSSTRVLPPQADEGTGLVIGPMRREGDAIVLDITQPKWAGTIRDTVEWVGDIYVDGDLTIAPEGRLVIYNTARVHIAGSDRLRQGLDPERCELYVEGALEVRGGSLSRFVHPRKRFKPMRPGPAAMGAASERESWVGILSVETAQVSIADGALELRNAIHGFLAPGELPMSGVGVATVIEAAPELLMAAAADTFGLGDNYPNPFDELTTIPYSLDAGGEVELVVYNSVGQAVRTLVNDYRFEGSHEAVWDATDDSGREVGSGVYLYTLSTPQRSANGKMMRLLGYAQLSDLNEDLRRAGEEWGAVQAELRPVGSAAGAFGFAARATPVQAAMGAGQLFVALAGAALYGDADAARPLAGELSSRLTPYERSPQYGEVEAALAGVAAGMLRLGPADAKNLRVGLRTLLAEADGRALTYFTVGEWLQTLKASCLVAQRVPEADRAEWSANASLAGHWAAELRSFEGGAGLAGALARIASLLGAEPVDIEAVLSQIEAATGTAGQR